MRKLSSKNRDVFANKRRVILNRVSRCIKPRNHNQGEERRGECEVVETQKKKAERSV